MIITSFPFRGVNTWYLGLHRWESKLNMDLLPPELHDVAILRRILFASVYVPKDLPDYWLAVTNFASQGGLSLQPQSVKIAVENLTSINEKAFATDKQLLSELYALRATPSNPRPLGIILISSCTNCRLCGGKLLIRNDRGSHIMVYTESFGTVIGHITTNFARSFGMDAVSDSTTGTALKGASQVFTMT